MPMHWVPWLVGGFLLMPFMIWAALAVFVFPGAWNGFNAVVGTGALGATLPLAFWFFLRGIGGFANAMAGTDPDGELRHWLPRMILRLLPLSAVLLGGIGAAAVVVQAGWGWGVLVPPGVGIVVAAGICGGESGVSRGLLHLPVRLRQRLRALLLHPAPLREVLANERGGRDWFLMNLALAGTLAALILGAPMPTVVIAGMIVVVGFITLYVKHASGYNRAGS